MATENITDTEIGEDYKKILQLNGINDKIDEILLHDSGATGDGMISLTQGITVKFSDVNVPKVHMFVKCHTDNPAHEVVVEEVKAFEKEAVFLSSYIPSAKSLCLKKGLPDFVDFYPKCYHASKGKIVMEDLAKSRGYQVIPHQLRHNFDMASHALETLAKHHALSYAMIQESGGIDAFSERFPDIDFDASQKESMTGLVIQSIENGFATAATILEKNQTPGSPDALVQINGMKGSAMEIIRKSMICDRSVEKLLVLSHGDYKNNNMMFLMDESTKSIRHMIVIDLQTSRFDSPALDLGYYLFTSVEHAVRQNRLEELLNVYLKMLLQSSASLGHPIKLTLDDLMIQCRRKFKFAFALGLTIVGPGIQLFKKIDITKIDFKDIFNIFQNLLLAWMDENPDEGMNVASEIVGLITEYNQLGL